MSTAKPAASLDDLLDVDGKAELIAGRIVRFMPTGFRPGRIAARVFRSLDDFAEESGRGVATTDDVGFAVAELSSGRESFAPDAAYYTGPLPTNPMRFLPGPPTFAVEVRSENDYGPAAESEMAAKRADYFEAGTLVVWDVDPVASRIRKYRRDRPERCVEFGPGDQADAEPAATGWRVAADRILA